MTNPVREYRLFPRNPNSPHWAASLYKGACIVRARSEREARQMAYLAFCIAASRSASRELLWSPWKQANITGIEVLRDCDPSADLELGVVDPPNHNYEVASLNWEQIANRGC